MTTAIARSDCAERNCTQPVATRGFCVKHYRYRLHTGQYGLRDAGEIRVHLAQLRGLGWTWRRIAEAAGVDTSGLRRVAHGRYARVRRETAAALLAVEVPPEPRPVLALGVRRRVHALAWMGWSHAEIARRVGVTELSLRTLILPSRTISPALVARIAAVYEELQHHRGPSNMSAGRARSRGFAPPMAWDDIDNPLERPKGVRRRVAAREAA